MRAMTRNALVAAGVGAGLVARAALRRRGLPSLDNQAVLITGGSRGLGLALAHAFAREGCRVAICARDAAELEAAKASLDGGGVLTVQCDVTDRQQVETAIERVTTSFGGVDILVNNAGEIQVGPLESMGLEDFEQAMSVMFWGGVYPTWSVLPQMRARQSGRIVNITSIGAKVAVPHLLPYTCAKFAMIGFSEGLRAELSGKGIKIVTIAPGLMRTGSHLNAFFKGDREQETLWFSLGATLPGISMSAERAARQIVEATKRGDAERILSVPANFLARWHALFPGMTADILGWVNRVVLPAERANGKQTRGREAAILRTPWMSALTVLGRRAARRLLQEPA
jgi:NAD(P)-dependent dehydrogenase (short-subunit alcohol dehydrogenase family)